jgi:predicted O-methyltransferase YrrM
MLSAILRTVKFFKSPRTATTWAAEFIDDRITTQRHHKHLNFYAERQLSVSKGISKVLGIDESIVVDQLDSLPDFLVSENKDPGMTIQWSATSELATTIYALVKILKPATVVETGVGAGVSSWTILKAMEENGIGRLISIDLPTPNTELLPDVGYLIPTELRHRWDLRTGPSNRLLPQVLKELDEIDMFQHDSRHSYSNQLREYTTAWPSIKQSGILVSDDISNDALHDATQKWNTKPVIIGQSKESPIGLVQKI